MGTGLADMTGDDTITGAASGMAPVTDAAMPAVYVMAADGDDMVWLGLEAGASLVHPVLVAAAEHDTVITVVGVAEMDGLHGLALVLGLV
jgi:hypothetical protein